MRLRRWALLPLLCLLLVSATGCWDRRELEEEAFVLAVGVDKGEESQYSVTLAIAIPGKMAGGDKGGGGGDDKPFMLTTVEAPTVAGAMAMVDSYVDRRVSLNHAKALFIGEELAKKSGLYTMDEFVRFRQARRTIFYIVTKGKAADFLDGMKPVLEQDPQRFIETMTYNHRHTGMIPASSQIQTFITQVDTGYASPVTYYAALKEEEEAERGKETSKAESGFKAGEMPRKGGPNIEMLGGAVFKGERMVGVLTGDEMRMILLLQDKFTRGLFSLPDPNNEELFVSLDLERGRPFALTVDVAGERPVLRGLVSLEAELLAIQSEEDYTEPELQQKLEQHIASNLEEHLRAVLKKTQDWEADAAAFGEHAVKRFPTVQAWEDYNWPERYADAEIDIAVRVVLRRFGTQLSPPEAADQHSQ